MNWVDKVVRILSMAFEVEVNLIILLLKVVPINILHATPSFNACDAETISFRESFDMPSLIFQWAFVGQTRIDLTSFESVF